VAKDLWAEAREENSFLPTKLLCSRVALGEVVESVLSKNHQRYLAMMDLAGKLAEVALLMKKLDSMNSQKMLKDVRALIVEARHKTTVVVNVGLTALYWKIGKRVAEEVLGKERAAYGEQIVATLSRQLVTEFGRGYEEKNLRRMIQFAEAFPEDEIVATLWRQLSWSHFRELLPLSQPFEREFYAEMCRIEGWSVRTLHERIDSMLYERTAISKQPDTLIRQELAILRSKGDVSPALVLKDPYVLDFLGLTDRFLEHDLEDAILRELETFLLELGAGFSFVARQKRIQLDGEDFYLDLLFYNRKLKRLVVVELKQGRFKSEYKGQMELYLRWLAQHEREPDENMPLGIILCAGKNTEQIELLELSAAGIHVAEYLTVLPPPEVLYGKLHEQSKHVRLVKAGRQFIFVCPFN
jgi:predicted nuclease of restriction endonuclease-like (RecB) superfamily